MAKEFETLKGTHDYLPHEQVLRDHIKDILKKNFIKYGFPAAETPIVCMLDLLTSKYSADADILDEIYQLSDQGERALGLRYDLTICLTKLISSNRGITLPFKRHEIGRVYRDGPVKLGRNREFTQCDVDAVGISSMLQEAEFMNLTHHSYKDLGLDVEILYNNRKLLYGLIIETLGQMDEDILRKCIMLVDKLDKMTKEALAKEFAELGFGADKFENLYATFSMTYEEIKDKYKDSEVELLQEGLKELDELHALTANTDANESMAFKPFLARGIDIYTSTVWEIFLKDRVVNGHEFNVSLGGGGRYDKIIGTFIDDGNEYPAIGMSFGLDVIYEVLKAKSEGENQPLVDLFIIPMDTQVPSFILAENLRKLGLKVEIEKVDRRVKKSMNYANKEGIPFVTVIGGNEIEKGQIYIKQMATGVEMIKDIDDYEGITQFICS